MVKETKFYDQLGVSPDASEAQLKTAYKKGALRHHPDKNPGNADAEHKFKELSQAYETLSDPQKRQIYDQYGEAGLEQGGAGGGAGMSAEDLFSQFFGGGGGGGFGGMFGGGGGPGFRQRPQKVKAQRIEHQVRVELKDVYKGKSSKFGVKRNARCITCEGRGGKAGVSPRKCDACGGAGQRIELRRMGPMVQQVIGTCDMCKGNGEIMKEKDKCPTCKGKKLVEDRKVLHVHIDRGVEDGKLIEFPNEGDWVPGCEELGDVVFQVKILESDKFQRKKDDLYHAIEIDLLTALAGGVIHIEHLDDRWLNVEILPGEFIAPGSVKIVRGQGMPSYRHHDFGDLFLMFKVKFPTAADYAEGQVMTEEHIKMLETALPPRIQGAKPPADAMTEDFGLEDISTQKEYRRAQRVEEDDDEEGMGPGGERVQCATQ